MKKLVIATGNKNKVKEIKSKLEENNIKVELITVDQPFNPEETGVKFSQNAYIKAYAAAKKMNMPAIGDDSGLCIDALAGEPGIYSARYADTNEERIQKVLDELKDVPREKRTAHFVSALAVVDPAGETLYSCEGKCEGIILDELKGNNGFGYDPIFYIPELAKTMAELDMKEKNRVSHRSDALNQFIEWYKYTTKNNFVKKLMITIMISFFALIVLVVLYYKIQQVI